MKCFILLLTLLLLTSGCTKNDSKPQSTLEIKPSATPIKFEEGILFNLKEEQSNLIEKGIIENLQKNMDSLIENNSEEFKESFLSEKHALPFMMILESGDQYRFIKVEEITRIQAYINIKVTCDKLTTNGEIKLLI